MDEAKKKNFCCVALPRASEHPSSVSYEPICISYMPFFFHYFIHLNLRIWKNRRNIYNYTLARAVSHTKKQKHILAGSIVMYTFCSVHGNTHTSVLLIALFNKNAHMFLIPICSSAGWLLRMFSDVYEVSTPFAVCVCIFCGAHGVC